MAISTAARRLKTLMEELPIPDELVHEAEVLIKECSEADLAALGLGPPPRPVVPRGLMHDNSKDSKPVGPQQRLYAVQTVINSLQYNHTPGYYYNVIKSRPFSRIMDTAREALRAALPIKCLEAVFLGALLTAGWSDLDRLPLAFKSSVQGQTYRHIVLVVFHNPSRKWGALGLSRRPELMDKDMVYDSLADLVTDYKQSYERWWHTLVRVYVGLPLEHDTYYAGPVCWRYLTLSLTGRKSWMTHRTSLDKFAAQARRLAAKFRSLGGKPTTNGSLGGPEAPSGAAPLPPQPQQPPPPPQPRHSGGTGGGGTAPQLPEKNRGAAAHPQMAGSASVTAAATRYAKSVSPARRRPYAAAVPPLPPPPPRRPITPLRSHGSGAPAAPRPPGGAAQAGPKKGKAGPAAAAAAAATCTGGTGVAANPASGAGNGDGGAHAKPNGASNSGNGVGDGNGGGAAAEVEAGGRSETGAGGAGAESAPAKGGGGVESDDKGFGSGGGGKESSHGGSGGRLMEQKSSGGGVGQAVGGRDRRERRARRSSDPGSAAALAAAAAAAAAAAVDQAGQQRGAREHVRMLRQRISREEGRREGAAESGAGGGGGRNEEAVEEEAEDEVGIGEESEEESEDSSEEEEYISEGSADDEE